MGRYPTAIRVGCKLHMGWINGWCSVLLSYDGRAENENLVLGCSGVVVSMLVASRGLSVNLSFDLIIFVMGDHGNRPAIKSKRNPNFRELTQSVQRWGES
jgi:hypothetical protein